MPYQAKQGVTLTQAWLHAQGGVLTNLAERECATLMGRFFYKKSLNMGPVFYPKNP